ncbi:MAG: hypothetical protein HY236_13920 [Acidobacteria bacterium]|nr:hypothetical protein [Acidobacteriota bacterium]
MDERLKQLMQQLGAAINDSLSESEVIAEAIGEIRQAGYDVFLVLEATIGFNRRRSADETQGEEAPAARSITGKIRLTSQDQEFLKAMKISVEESAET